jgi:ribosomal protein L13
VVTGAGQNIALHIIVDTPGVTVGRVARGLANLLNEYTQAYRHLLVITAQAAVLIRIAGDRAGWNEHPPKEHSLDQAD